MPLLNFQKQFAGKVEAGEKCQTIRAKRKYPIKAGDILYLYTGLRTKQCRKLGINRCKQSMSVKITKHTLRTPFNFLMDNISIDAMILDKFAKKDGFKNYDEMTGWFKKTHGLPFDGDLIKW